MLVRIVSIYKVITPTGGMKMNEIMSKEDFFQFFIKKASEVYIAEYGLEKWESLTTEEKHDAVMFMAKGLYEMMG